MSQNEAICVALFIGFICGAVFGLKMTERQYRTMAYVEEIALDLNDGLINCEELMTNKGRRFKCEEEKP